MTLRYVRLLFHSARPSSAADWETFSLLLTAKRIDSASIILSVRASAHERFFFFAAVVKQPQRPIISWLCARTAKETHVLLTVWRSVYATQVRGTCSVTCFTTIL